MRAGERVREGMSFSLWGLRLSLQQDVLISPSRCGCWSPGTTLIHVGWKNRGVRPTPALPTYPRRSSSPGLSLHSPSSSPCHPPSPRPWGRERCRTGGSAGPCQEGLPWPQSRVSEQPVEPLPSFADVPVPSTSEMLLSSSHPGSCK